MSAFEKHYTTIELGKMWGISRQSVRRRLANYLHLIPDFNMNKRRSRFGPIKRRYAMLRIPHSLASRIQSDFIGSRAA